MLAMPISSPQMMRMFGLRPDGAEGVACAGAAFCACASAPDVSVAAATSVDVPSRRFLRSSMWPVFSTFFLSSLLIFTPYFEIPAGVATGLRRVMLVRRLKTPLHLFNHLIDAEARRPLARRKLLEGGEEFTHKPWRRNEHTRSVRHEPVVVGVRGDIRALVGVRPQVEDFRDAQFGKRLGPNS